MNKLTLLFCVIILIFSSCKKDDPASSVDEITYEVSVSDGGFYAIIYSDETQAMTGLKDISANTWKTTFRNKAGRPRTLSIDAIPNLMYAKPAVTVILKIYLNGTMVKTGTGGIAGALQYNLL